MDIYKLKFTQFQMEIFRILCINAGKRINQREISLLLNVSPTSVGNSLDLLKKENLVKIIKEKSNLNIVEINRDNKRTMDLKRAENFKMIIESGLSDFLENIYPGTTIILFGSYSRGDDIYTSDIDLAVIGSKEKNIDLKKFEKILQKEIRINYYPNLKIDQYIKNNLCNGIVLSGGIEL